MPKLLTSDIIPKLKEDVTGTILWSGNFQNYLMGENNAITLTKPLSNYHRVAFDVGLNNWSGGGRQLIYANASGGSYIISLSYASIEGSAILRLGILTRKENKLYWESNRSWNRIFFGTSGDATTTLSPAADSEDGITLYNVIGYKDF